MRKLVQLAFLLVPLSLYAQTPALVQVRQAPSDVNAGGAVSYESTCFANPTQVGNTILAFVSTNDTPITNVTVSDDGSNAYTMEKDEIADSQTTAIFLAPVTTASRCVTLNLNTGGNDNQLVVMEWTNISTASPVDTTCSAAVTSGTSPACGSMTTTGSGELIIDLTNVVAFGTKPTGYMTWLAQTGDDWKLAEADGLGWTAVQYEIQSTAGAINPAITTSTAVSHANVVGLALKPASSGGGQGSSIHVNSIYSFIGIEYPTISTGTTMVLQAPCGGDDLWLAVNEATAHGPISSITDNNGNTWSSLTAAFNGSVNWQVQWWHTSTFASCGSNETLTLTLGSAITTGSNPNYWIFDISNSGGYDSSAACGSGSTPCNLVGSSAITAGVLTGSVITPSESGGVLLGVIQEEDNTVVSSTPGNNLIGCISESGTPACSNAVATNAAWEQDAGANSYTTSSTASKTFTWTYADTNASPVNAYWTSVVSLLPKSSSIGATHLFIIVP